jgi:NIPSNAP
VVFSASADQPFKIRGVAKQLRMYTVKPGEMDAWCQEWGENILPLRLQRGFRVVGPWVIDETNQFVWMLEHDGDFEVADSRYNESPERKELDPNPARHLEKTERWMLRDP